MNNLNFHLKVTTKKRANLIQSKQKEGNHEDGEEINRNTENKSKSIVGSLTSVHSAPPSGGSMFPARGEQISETEISLGKGEMGRNPFIAHKEAWLHLWHAFFLPGPC